MPPSTSLLERRWIAPTVDRPRLVTPGRAAATVGSAVLRAVAAALSGLLLAGGAALVLWAVTPGSGPDAAGFIGGGVVAFAAAHFLPVFVGGVSVTLPPLLLTVLMVAVIASAAGRARPVRGRALEATHAGVFAAAYGSCVYAVAALLAPAGTVTAGLSAPLGVGAVGALLGVAAHRTAWNRWWRQTAPRWLQAGVRGGAVAVCLLILAGALVLAVGLALSFAGAADLFTVSAQSVGAGLGMLLLCAVFLPNAVVTGIGYVSGAGFSIGAGSYSPLSAHAADLPAIPLLAAVPDASGESRWSMVVVVAAPALAGLLIGVIACRIVSTRRDRLAGSALAAIVAGISVAGLAALSGGGVAGGPWASTGAPPLLTGGLIAGILLLTSLAWSGAAGWGGVAWAPPRARPAADPDGDIGDDADFDGRDDEPADAVDAVDGIDTVGDAELPDVTELALPGVADSADDVDLIDQTEATRVTEAVDPADRDGADHAVDVAGADPGTTDAEPDTGTDVSAEPDTEPDTEPDSEPDTDTDAGTGTDPEPDADTGVETEPDTDPEPDTGAGRAGC